MNNFIKLLVNSSVKNMEPGTPAIVRNGMQRWADSLNNPAVPAMTQEEFAKLSKFDKLILTCNMPGCGDVVSTHGGLCVKHGNDRND